MRALCTIFPVFLYKDKIENNNNNNVALQVVNRKLNYPDSKKKNRVNKSQKLIR